MKTPLLLCVGIMSLGIGSACAADVDLLSFDPLPSADAKSDLAQDIPLDVVPRELQSPAPVSEPLRIEREVKPQVKPASAKPPAVAKESAPKPQPPVEVKAPTPTPLPAFAEKIEPTLAPATPVEPLVPPPAAALPPVVPAPAKAVETPKVRPVLKVTGSAAENTSSEASSPKSDINEKAKPSLTPKPLKPVVVKPPVLNPEETPPPAPESLIKTTASPVIAFGDPLHIEVSGESDLSGWYKVSPDGSIQLPLIGQVRAQGFTHAKLAEILTATLKDGYLVNPQVSVTGGTPQ